MGYTTEFNGQFTLDKPISNEKEYKEFCEHCHKEDEASGCPGGYCQWTISGTTLKWDGEEKFYDYEEWLNYVIEHFIKPSGCVLNGDVEWEGEDGEDVGVMSCRNNVVASRLKEFVKIHKDFNNNIEKLEVIGWMTECGCFMAGQKEPDMLCEHRKHWIRATAVMTKVPSNG